MYLSLGFVCIYLAITIVAVWLLEDRTVNAQTMHGCPDSFEHLLTIPYTYFAMHKTSKKRDYRCSDLETNTRAYYRLLF